MKWTCKTSINIVSFFYIDKNKDLKKIEPNLMDHAKSELNLFKNLL
jgi:hypothetical protein